MLTLVAYIACVTVLVAVVYLGFAFLYDLVLRLIARLPAPAQDRLLGTGVKEPHHTS
ncbi:MAG TPA: hypothetical protein VER79_04380 [Candidatus Limnocylindrales bacterium]|jgi:hypothetical protein|nr:hypothetical protein [Candidatus Limnocylindrales bacterium]